MADTTGLTGNRGLLATGGVIGAALTASCCVAPLIFVTLGISGAWVGYLTALAPYQWLFVAASFGFLGAGFWSVYLKPKPACKEDRYCASPKSGRLVKATLWFGTALVAIAIGVNVLTPFLL